MRLCKTNSIHIFLFNSLNTLIAEIEYNPGNAVRFTKHLSSVYRYVIQCQDKTLVTFSEELDFYEILLLPSRSPIRRLYQL